MNMEEVLRWSALALAGLLLVRVTGREFGVLVTLAVCAMILWGAVEFLQPVTEFLRTLRRLARLEGDALGLLFKAAGIGLVAQLAGLLCADGGESALAKALELLASAAILWLSIPMLEEILGLLQDILEGF